MSLHHTLSVDTTRTLAHVALLAAEHGQAAPAEQIFAALQAVRPLEPNIGLCRALLLTEQGQHAEAFELLRRVTQSHPSHMGARSMLGYVMFRAGERGWQPVLETVADDGSDPSAVKLARAVLDEHREYTSRPDESAGSRPVLLQFA